MTNGYVHSTRLPLTRTRNNRNVKDSEGNMTMSESLPGQDMSLAVT